MSKNLSHGGLRFCQVTDSLKMKENSLHSTLHIYTLFKSKIFIYVNILIKSYVLMDKCIDFLVIYIYKWCKNDLHKRNLLFLNLYKNNLMVAIRTLFRSQAQVIKGVRSKEPIIMNL